MLENLKLFGGNKKNNSNQRYSQKGRNEEILNSMSSNRNLNSNSNINSHEIIIIKPKLKNKESKNETQRKEYIINNEEITYKCLFCDKISDNEKYNSYFTCAHFFCKKCGKIFYGNKIQKMILDNNLTSYLCCPIIDCPKKISISILELIFSKEYYNEIMINLDKNNIHMNQTSRPNNNKKDITILKTETIPKKSNEINFKVKIDNIAYNYFQKNIIDLNSYNNYINRIEKFRKRCPSCQHYSLFDKVEGNYNVCLKCKKRYCKYCHKIYDNRHFDKSNINYCKIFYRQTKVFQKENILKKYWRNLIMVIGAYLLVLFFPLIYMKEAIKNKNIILKIIYIIFCSIIFIIFLPVFLIFLPYFPIIISF